MNIILAHTIDYCFGVICRHCEKKVLDPDKVKKQKYLEDNCPYCGKSGSKSLEFKDKEFLF